ncbi:MAG: hypothetical protein KDA92_01375 [Planctomycetales bacterium]|nr:hypothetical protein [Planctomycetales bacterium]
MFRNVQRNLTAFFGVGLLFAVSSPAVIAADPFQLQGPGVNRDDFRLTEFASGLNFPVGMTELSDGSILVAVSNGSSFFGSTSGSLIRLADTDGDGIADSTTTLVDNVPSGKLTALRSAGQLLVTTGQGSGAPIAIYRKGATPSDPPSLAGKLTISYSGSWLHPHSALAIRETPGVPNSYDLVFQLGSRENFAETTTTLNMTSNIGPNAQLAGDALHLIRITDDGTNLSSSPPIQLATGLRNAAGMVFDPLTNDLYLQDNGIDGLVNPNEPHSADELNVISAADIATTLVNFGFPENYTQYRTGNLVGGAATQPLVAFQPIPAPDGSESEGPNDIALSPTAFPAALQGGMFVTMHGKFPAAGVANEENPLVYVNLADNSYFHMISNDEPNVGHIDGLLSTYDSLYMADISPNGGFANANSQTGKIYRLQSLASSIPGDFNNDGSLDATDIDLLTSAILAGKTASRFDVNEDGTVSSLDRTFWVNEIKATYLGDSNLDGQFDTADFVFVMQRGKYADGIAGNAGWADGDWDGDGDFESSDLVLAMQEGGYEQGPRPAVASVPEPNSLMACLSGLGGLSVIVRRKSFT